MSFATRELFRSTGEIFIPRSAVSAPSRLSLTFPGPGRTKQSFKDECDIRIIMKRYETTGVIQSINHKEARYLDTTGFDFQNAMNLVAGARALFEDLPASLRDRFSNEPARLLDFVHDPANLAESIKLGFIDRSKLPQATQDELAGLTRPSPTPKPSAPPTTAPSPVSADPAPKP